MAYFDAPYRPADLSLNSDSINNSLVGFWPLTDGSGTSAVDISTGGNNGTQSGGVTWASTAKGTAASFDGSDDRFSISTDLSRNQTAFSCSAWIKPDTVDRRFIWYESNSLNVVHTRFGLRTESSGNLQCVGRDDDGDSFTVFAQSGSGVVSTNKWQHVVGIFDPTGNGCKVFLDGVDVTSSSVNSGDGFPNTASLVQSIGTASTNYYWFDGLLSNIRVFNAALTASQVEQLYTRPWTGTNYDTEALWLSPPASPVLSTASEATSLMANCVGWWPLVKGSGTVATDLVGSNDGTQSGGVSWENSEIGNVASFDGVDDYFNLASNTAIDLVSNFTVIAWVKCDAASGTRYIAAKATNLAFQYGIYQSNTSFRALMGNATNGVQVVTAGTVSTGNWQMVVGMYDGTDLKCEVWTDGSSVSASVTAAGSGLHQLAIPFNIGARNNGKNEFDGNIQNVRVFDAALTADQIRLLYERPWIGAEYNETAPLYPPVPSSLTPLDSSSINTDQELWLPLTDGTGTTAVDISGGGNDGTFAGQSGGLPTWRNSQVGTVLESNGSQERRVEVVNDFMTSYSAMSVSLWCYFDSFAGYNVNFAYSGLDYSFMMRTLTGGNGAYQFITNSLSGNTDLRTSNGTFGTGQWHMFTCTYDGSIKKTYVDGVEAASASATGTISAATKDTDILTAQGSGWNVEGSMQNVRVWSRALSASEVADIYYSPWLGSAYPSTGGGTPSYFVAAQFNRLGIGPRFRRL